VRIAQNTEHVESVNNNLRITGNSGAGM